MLPIEQRYKNQPFVADLKNINECLQKEVVVKDREIQKLNKDMHQYEEIISNLRNELAVSQYRVPEVPKKDAEVMAGMCCTGADCGDWEPVKDLTVLRLDETVDCVNDKKTKVDLKSSSLNILTLRNENIYLSKEVDEARKLCLALEDKYQVAKSHSQFKDELIREMKRQLKHSKEKLRKVKEMYEIQCHAMSGDTDYDMFLYDSSACVRKQPRRHDVTDGRLGNDVIADGGDVTQFSRRSLSECTSPRLLGSDDDTSCVRGD